MMSGVMILEYWWLTAKKLLIVTTFLHLLQWFPSSTNVSGRMGLNKNLFYKSCLEHPIIMIVLALAAL